MKESKKRSFEPLTQEVLSWRVPDAIWEKIQPIIHKLDPPPKRNGRGRTNAREALDAIIYRMRTGITWNRLPSEFPDDSGVNRSFSRWKKSGAFDKIWVLLKRECRELDLLPLEWREVEGYLRNVRHKKWR